MTTDQSSLSNVYVGQFGTMTTATVGQRRATLESVFQEIPGHGVPHSDAPLEESDMAESEPNERIAKLETHFEYIQRDLGEIRTDQRTILDRTAKLPTTGNLWTMIGTVAAVAFAIIAIFVGVLTLLQKPVPAVTATPAETSQQPR